MHVWRRVTHTFTPHTAHGTHLHTPQRSVCSGNITVAGLAALLAGVQESPSSLEVLECVQGLDMG